MRTRVVVGILVLFIGVGALFALDLKRPKTVSSFITDYTATSDVHAQQAVAAAYLQQFSFSDLSAELEKKYPLSLCHTKGHGLGRALYARDGNFTESVKMCGGSCNYGCFHGVMMEMFSTDSDSLGGAIDELEPAAYMEKIRTGAQQLCADPDVQSVVLPAFCTHGVGHVFAVAAPEDLRTALGACGVFTTRHAAASCASGVFMEYALQPEHKETIRDKGFSICDPYPRYAESCYRYMAPITISALGGTEHALRACQAMSSEYLQNSCIFGVAYAQLSQEDLAREDGIDRVCGALTKSAQKEACVRGGIVHVVTNWGDRVSNASCEAMAPIYQGECLQRLSALRNETIE